MKIICIVFLLVSVYGFVSCKDSTSPSDSSPVTFQINAPDSYRYYNAGETVPVHAVITSKDQIIKEIDVTGRVGSIGPNNALLKEVIYPENTKIYYYNGYCSCGAGQMSKDTCSAEISFNVILDSTHSYGYATTFLIKK